MFDMVLYNAKIVTLDDNMGSIEKGYILINKGKIVEIAEGSLPKHLEAQKKVDAKGLIVMPGLVDCHTHLMEYAALELHKTLGKAQKLSGISNLLTALKSGIVALGEHHLGHPLLTQKTKDYKGIVKNIPIDVKFAVGCCFIGTELLTVVSSTAPGKVVSKDELSMEEYKKMAIESQFPGENIFLNATVANLPLSAAPRAGEITFTMDELKEIVGIFHASNKKIGAHIEGDEAAEMFIQAGGDVIHHGHRVGSSIVKTMADKNISLVITPHGGTSSVPTSPHEVYEFYKHGVKIALASDSYLPLHPEAHWIKLAKGKLIGPDDFLKICYPIFQYFKEKGVSNEECLKFITINGREILGMNHEAGSIVEGKRADFIVCSKLPGIETDTPEDIRMVIKDGEIVINKE
ncbi:MAG: hypothetical protein PWQ82_513 [Thermosediminibacterales bacterium]|nr:hypothetical protein [Thermosediminibacterales bacterium]